MFLLHSMAIAMPAAAFVQGAPPAYPLFDTDSDHATPGWISLNHFGALDTRSFDYDGDNDLDVLTFFPAFNASHPAPQGGMYVDPHGNARWIRVWRNELNETSGGFPEVLPSDPDFPFDTSVQLDSPGSTQINGPYTMLLLDIDDDGFDDLVVANQRTYDCVFYWDDVTNRWGNHTRLYSTLPSGMPGGTAQPSAVMLSRNANPWDNGVADLCCIGDSSCTFPQAQSRFTVAMDTAHLNEDKFPDLVLGFRDHGPVVLLNNHGGWHPSGVSDPFVEVETLPVFPDESDWEYPNMANRVVVLGDLDGDGDADCIVGRSSSKTWQCQAAALDPQPSYVRKDDRLDAVRVYENVFGETGATGYFEPHSKLAPGADPAAVPPGAVTYLNLEPGNQGPSLGSPGSPSLQVHLADLNGDGIDDLSRRSSTLPVTGTTLVGPALSTGVRGTTARASIWATALVGWGLWSVFPPDTRSTRVPARTGVPLRATSLATGSGRSRRRSTRVTTSKLLSPGPLTSTTTETSIWPSRTTVSPSTFHSRRARERWTGCG